MRKKFMLRFTIFFTIGCVVLNCFLIYTFINMLSRL